MSRTHKDSPKSTGPGRGRPRNISVRAVRRDPPDLRKLARALITIAMDEVAAEAAQTELDHVDGDASEPLSDETTTTDADHTSIVDPEAAND